MKLKSRQSRTEQSYRERIAAIQTAVPRYFTLRAAAQALGLSPDTLKALEAQGVIAPTYADDSQRRMRLYTADDLAKIIAYYEQRGGPRVIARRRD
jgi:hypothetical protein